MASWMRFFGKPKVGETKPVDPRPQHVIIEFVCTTAGCKFETLSLTQAQEHLRDTMIFGMTTESHNMEPRGFLYPPKDDQKV